MAPTLTTHDTRYDDPDRATIAKVLASLDGGRNVLATLERTEVTYLQAEGTVRTGFVLEYQDGSLDRHYRSDAATLPLDRVIAMFDSYARGDDAGWRIATSWQHVPFVPEKTPWFSTWWGYAVILLAVAGLIWWWRR
jgi:hypothetical protein